MRVLTNITSPPQDKFDGLDMSQAMTGKAASPRTQPICWVRPPDRPGPRGRLPDLAIRDGKWKLLTSRDGTRVELFDVVADPNEKTNLAKEHADIADRLKQTVIAWDKETSK